MGTSTAVDVTLTVGSTNETVSVVASDQTLELDTSTIDDSIQPEQVDKLPLTVGGWRSLETLENLVPGVVGVGVAGSADTIKINGGQEEGTDFLIDGITTNRQENGSGSFGILSPSVDAVNEFHISIASLPIDEGRTTGGLANYNTKGGTNDFHGSVYEFFKNAGLDANNWFDNGYIAQQGEHCGRAGSNTSAPPTPRMTTAATWAAPFSFRNSITAGTRASSSLTGNSGVRITAAQSPASCRRRPNWAPMAQYFDFSSLLGGTLGTSPCGETVYAGEIFDPQYDNTTVPCRYAGFGQTVTGGPGAYVVSGAPTNKIPIGRASAVAKNIINTYLMPLATAGSVWQQLLQLCLSQPRHCRRTPPTAFASTRASAPRTKCGDSGARARTPTRAATQICLLPIQTCCGTVNQLGKLARAGWDWIITPNLFNSLTVGGNRSANINKSKASQMGTDWDQKLDIPNGFSDDFPVFEFYGNTFGSLGQQEDSTDTDNVVALNDILHWQKGAHSFVLGGEGQYHQYSWVSRIGGTCSGNAGCLQFWDNQTASDEDFWGQDGNSFAAFEIGETGLGHQPQRPARPALDHA